MMDAKHALRFGVSSMQAPPTKIRIASTSARQVIEHNLANLAQIPGTRGNTDLEDSDDEDSNDEPDSESEAPCEDSPLVQQKANWELHRRFPLGEKDGWSAGCIRAVNKLLDAPFGRHVVSRCRDSVSLLTSCRKRKTCDLHRIPAEIRNRIYELVLVSDKPINATRRPRDAVNPLLQVCRQVRQEALPMFYSRNTFMHLVRNANTAHLCLWLSSIGKQSCAFVNSLAVCCEGIIRPFNYQDAKYVEVSQAWMALAKALYRSGVRRHAIGTFSDNADPDRFEDDEELEQAELYARKFHDVVMPDHLDRAGYCSEEPTKYPSQSEPRGHNYYYAAPELDLIEADERRKRGMDYDVRLFRALQTDPRFQTYLANGGGLHTDRARHESTTPLCEFYRAPDAGEAPELSAGFLNLIRGVFAKKHPSPEEQSRSKDVAGSSAATTTIDTVPSPRDVSRATVRKDQNTGLKRKRDVGDEGSDLPETDLGRPNKHPRASAAEYEEIFRSKSGMIERSNRKRLFVKTRRSTVTRRRAMPLA